MENEKQIKKSNKGIIVVVFIVIAVIAVIAAFVIGKKTRDLTGKYELIDMKANDNAISQSDIEKMKKLGLTVTLEMREDGTGTLNMFGEKKKLTYNEKKITVEGDSADYTFEDEKLTFKENGEEMVFERVSEDV